VGSDVGLEIEVETESLVADVTLEWLLPCVNQLVSLQLRIVQELLTTTFVLTYELSFSMCELMLTIGCRVREFLVTRITL